MNAYGYLFMACLSLQFGLQPIFTQRFVAPAVLKTTAVLACEVCKCVLAAASLVASGQVRSALSEWTLASSLALAGVPAVIYAGQNVMIQVAYQYLDPLTFNLINQTKMLFTAAAVYMVVGTKQSPMQCLALVLVMASALVLTGVGGGKVAGSGGGGDGGDGDATADAADAANYTLGLVCVLGASLCSGLATGFCQKVLVKRNSLLYSFELSALSACTLAVSIFASGTQGGGSGESGGAGGAGETGTAAGMGWAAGGKLLADLFVGWTPYTAIPILTNACGGLFVGLVVKHAGGVRKGFTTILGILITAFAKLFFFGDALSKQTLIALPLVTVACWMHIKFRTPPTNTAEEAKKKN